MTRSMAVAGTFLVVALGCSDDGTSPRAADLDDLRVELGCTGPGSAEVNCATPELVEDAATLRGESGSTYQVTIRVRGVVEQRSYNGGTGEDGMWLVGGAPDQSTFNLFRLRVSSPSQTYHLNAGITGVDQCWLLDVEKTITMTEGALLTLHADAGGDGLSTVNEDDQGEPIVVPGVPPAPGAFDGQFVQVDVVRIVGG